MGRPKNIKFLSDYDESCKTSITYAHLPDGSVCDGKLFTPVLITHLPCVKSLESQIKRYLGVSSDYILHITSIFVLV